MVDLSVMLLFFSAQDSPETPTNQDIEEMSAPLKTFYGGDQSQRNQVYNFSFLQMSLLGVLLHGSPSHT